MGNHINDPGHPNTGLADTPPSLGSEIIEVPGENRFSHIPPVSKQEEVIEQWIVGNAVNNLIVPLKDWPSGTRTESMKYKYHDRKLIASE